MPFLMDNKDQNCLYSALANFQIKMTQTTSFDKNKDNNIHSFSKGQWDCRIN